MALCGNGLATLAIFEFSPVSAYNMGKCILSHVVSREYMKCMHQVITNLTFSVSEVF